MTTPDRIVWETGEMMDAAHRAVASLPADAGTVAAVAAVRSALGRTWPAVIPGSVKDVLIIAARQAVQSGWAEAPEELLTRFPGGYDGSDGMLALTAEWIAAGQPDGPGGFEPPEAFAALVAVDRAFDRDHDEGALTSAAVLLALAELGVAACKSIPSV